MGSGGIRIRRKRIYLKISADLLWGRLEAGRGRWGCICCYLAQRWPAMRATRSRKGSVSVSRKQRFTSPREMSDRELLDGQNTSTITRPEHQQKRRNFKQIKLKWTTFDYRYFPGVVYPDSNWIQIHKVDNKKKDSTDVSCQSSQNLRIVFNNSFSQTTLIL